MIHLISTIEFILIIGYGLSWIPQHEPDIIKPLHSSPCSVNGCMCWRTVNSYTV